MSPTLDHVGPLTRCVADMAAVMDVISGWDANDPTSRPGAASAYLEHLSPAPAGIRIGLDRAALQGVAPEIRAALDAAADALQHAGCRIVDVTLPDLARAAAAWLPLCAPAMAVAHAEYFQNESARYGPVLRALVELGMRVPGTDVIRADLERRNFSGGVDALLGSVDLLLLPVQPMAPPTTESMRNRPKDPSASQRALLFTAPFNLSGHPSLSIPSTFTAAGAPVGVQLIARRNGEQLLLDVAAAYERRHPPEHRHPPALTGALHR